MSVPHKTTIYLGDELKVALTREAQRRTCSEAEIIRQAVTDAISRPPPRPGLIEGEPFAASIDELLAGFGER